MHFIIISGSHLSLFPNSGFDLRQSIFVFRKSIRKDVIDKGCNRLGKGHELIIHDHYTKMTPTLRGGDVDFVTHTHQVSPALYPNVPGFRVRLRVYRYPCAAGGLCDTTLSVKIYFITSSERHSLKSKALKWIIIRQRLALVFFTKHIYKKKNKKKICLTHKRVYTK